MPTQYEISTLGLLAVPPQPVVGAGPFDRGQGMAGSVASVSISRDTVGSGDRCQPHRFSAEHSDIAQTVPIPTLTTSRDRARSCPVLERHRFRHGRNAVDFGWSVPLLRI